MNYSPVNRFRTRRGRVLRQQIEKLADQLGRDITVLDVGGRPDYWGNVGLDRIARVILVNSSLGELDRPYTGAAPRELFTREVGDARDLSAYADKSVDLVHSNSVIEHVGGWQDMRAMAGEMLRVGAAGWLQTPAWECPVEPHFQAPFGHWLGKPAQARLMTLSALPRIRGLPRAKRRELLEGVNLLSHAEVRTLFPDQTITTERLLLVLPKSHIVRWMPEAAAPLAAPAPLTPETPSEASSRAA